MNARGRKGIAVVHVRVLAINQFYAPDEAATSRLLTELCEDLVAGGAEVTVIASQGSYLGGGQLPAREVRRGVEILRPFATRFGKGSIPARLSDYLTFWASSVGRAVSTRRPSVILTLTTPPMIAAGGALVSALRGVPLVTWVQDVYPEVAVEFGLFGSRHPLVGGLAQLNRHTHARAARIVALSEGMADRLAAQGAPRSKLRVIANWSDGDAIQPIRLEANSFRRSLVSPDEFLVMYSGNLGVGHDLDTLIEAASILRDHPRIRFAFVGEGARKQEAEAQAAHLPHVRFLPYQPRERLADSLSAADVHLASLKPGLEGLLVPSKLYGVLAAGRPLYYVGPETCEVSRVVREHDVGWRGAPGDATALADALVAAEADRGATRAKGERAREVFSRVFDRPLATGRWRELLREVG